jgi:hypothetical protein
MKYLKNKLKIKEKKRIKISLIQKENVHLIMITQMKMRQKK